MQSGVVAPNPILFSSRELRGRELCASEVPQLQALFDANPEYFVTINGHPAKPDQARIEFEELPPAHIVYTRRYVIGLFDAHDALAGIAGVLSDLMIERVWHVGLFIVASDLNG